MKEKSFEGLSISSQLSEFTTTEIDYYPNKLIHQLFEEQVARSPDQVAIVCENQQLTYAELNIRANQLAHHLQALGVGTEVLVGIYLERSLEVVIAILGIFKAGAAYVPLDPAYPKDRLAFMLEETQVGVILTQSQLVEGLPQQELRTVCFDTDWELISRHSQDTPISQVTEQNLAYVMYTSGSTGKPKGVQITHANVWHYLQSISQILQVNAEDIYFHTASFSFSSSVRQLLLPLSQGAKIVIATNEQIKNPLRLFELIQQKGITVFDTVASVWRYGLQSIENLDQVEKDLLLSSKLRLSVFSGGLLPCQLLKKVRSKLKNPPRIVNIYGQTETIGVTGYPIPAEFDQEQGYVPVGYALDHIHQLCLLDEHLQPVAVGEVGELHVAGASLTRGYLNRPDLTAEKLIVNPLDQLTSPLLKTGDIARYLPDGTLEVLGRVDFQVKLRGMRVELGEIESLLEKHPSIKETVISAIDDQQGDKRLVAYIVYHSSAQQIPQSELTRELRGFLEDKLPDYMVPSTFVVLEALPLTPNGKLDRLSLTAPEQYRPELESSFVAPRTSGEEVLAGIWAEVLGLERIGIHNNFFELGGHSLLATQVISRVRQVFSVELPLRHLFESPTVAELCQFIEANPQSESSVGSSGIERLSERVNLPLSFSQQRMWFLSQLEPESSAYNISVAYRITGQLNQVALEQSLAEITQRHEALRTTFSAVNGQAVQVIHQTQTLLLPLVDIQEEAEAQRLSTEFAEQPFDLATGPLWRVKLLRFGSQEHLLLVTIHHIVFDEWSLNVFFQELTALYQAFSKLAAETTLSSTLLPELPIQYADFAHWQQQWLQGEELEAQLSYWKQQLTSCSPVLELPTDRPRPPVMTFAGKKQDLALPKALTNALKTLSQKEGATLFMTLLAAFQILLYRYSGQSDIIVGSPIAGRNRAETEKLIGFFVNTLVLRTDLSGNPSFRELLGRVREVALGAYDHQNLPFEKLVEELRPERSLSYNPIFQVMFVLQNAPMLPIELPGLTLVPQSVERETSQFDLTLELEETASGLVGFFEYNTDLFDDTTITRMVGHFQTLLEGIVAQGEQKVSELPLLTTDERQQLLMDWNGFQTEYPDQKCFHQLFEEQVERNPKAVAVVFGKQQLTYGELNAKANQLAHYLRSLGVGPDSLVGICLERSLEMAVGFLGIFKSGGAYLPLDPKYPQDRLTFMLEDSQTKVLLTQQRLVESLPKHNAQVVLLDTDWETIAQQGQENPLNNTTAENLAYIIYTSGSTGKPKGVMIPHRGLVNHNLAIAELFNLQPSDRVLQFASISFDIAVEELFPSWITGVTVVFRPEEMISSGTDFLKFITQEQLTILSLPTAFWHEMVKDMSLIQQPLPSTLRLVAVGGEKASRSAYLTWSQLVGNNCRWLNTYGPTETTVTATFYDPAMTDQTHRTLSEIPIGRPLANAQVYILDQQLQPVPIGVPGELHIGGAGLARGYLNRPELTSEKFIANPYSDHPDARLYKTGDTVRYLNDSNIEFVGRIDNQVKIRGFRIELGEIDTVLEQHPALQQGVVIAREDVPGDKRLVAYVVPTQEQTPTTSELRNFVKERLPNYMVPTAFVILEELPMTANGKLNRRALPAPDLSREDLEETFVAPRNDVELKLTKLWEKVLSIEPIGVKDNFFELGGHSLLAVRLFSEIEQKFDKNLPLATLFQAPTVEQLASCLSQESGSTSQLSMQPIQPNGSKPRFFFFYGLGGIPLELRKFTDYLGLDQPVYGWEPDVKAVLEHTRIEDMAVQCVKDLRIVQPEGPYFIGGYCTGGTIAFEVAQQLQTQGQKVATLAIFEHGFSNLDHFKNAKFPKIDALLDSFWNKVYLLSDFLKESPQEQFHRLQLKLDTFKQKIIGSKLKASKNKMNSSEIAGTVENIDRILAAIPEELHETHSKFFNNQIRATRSYVPQFYAGRVTFFLSRRWSFSRFYNNIKKIWTKVAAGGVEIILLPTSHEMFKEPHIQVSAEKLRDCLNKAQSTN